MLATDDAQITIVNLPEDIEETKHVPTPCPQPQKKRPKLETPTPATLNQSRHVNKAEILESRLTEEPVIKTEADRLSMKILKKMKQMNTDLANLENQLLEQQFESQSQRQLIEDLQKQVRQLKRSAKTPGNSNPSELNSMFEFPLCRMSDIDQMEEQITSDPEVKESLARFFQMGQADKMDSILSWFSHELLMQFTCRTDRESLATHRSTDLSEIFQLMYSEYQGRQGDGTLINGRVIISLQQPGPRMGSTRRTSTRLLGLPWKWPLVEYLRRTVRGIRPRAKRSIILTTTQPMTTISIKDHSFIQNRG